jgi:hypothetical protein
MAVTTFYTMNYGGTYIVLAFLINNLGALLDAEIVDFDRVIKVLAGKKKGLLLI